MQEQRYDGTENLTPSVSDEQLLAASRDPRNRRVTLHAPGQVFFSAGRKYRVSEKGALELVSERITRKAARKRAKAARRAGRR